MRWVATVCLILGTAVPLKAFEQTRLTCSLLPQCTVNVNCKVMLVLNMDVEKTGEDWTVTSWYDSMKQASLIQKFQKMPVPDTRYNDLFLQSFDDFGGGIDIAILSLHEDGGVSLNTITGGDISGNSPYIGTCEKVA
ncbi:MAG: hypothetical protein Q9M48_02135 [Rhodobacterales bacterium]|nr:hypothetical protein [Rhodobacterales bacterium]